MRAASRHARPALFLLALVAAGALAAEASAQTGAQTGAQPGTGPGASPRAQARGQSPAPGPVFAAFDRGVEGRGGVTFVFSDPNRPDEFAPIAAYRVAPTAQGCGYDFAASSDIPDQFRQVPVLNPLDPETLILPAGLPSAMADLTVSAFQTMGVVTGPTALRAHQTCVRRLWERVVGLRR
jgi:hypothetical protein